MIPISKTILKKNEINSVLKPLKSGWLVQGQNVAEFENSWSSFTNSNYSIATTSCTSGLHLSLMALDLKPDSEVIVPAFTWISTANVVEQMGAKPIFCDINPDTFNIDVSKIERLITKKTKGIIPVHLFGLAADMKEIKYIAKKYGLWILEDAACGFGSLYKNKHVGTIGDIGVFSLHPRKSITTGEGGMITTNYKKFDKSLRILRDHGANMSDFKRHHGNKPYELCDHTLPGLNQRMTDIQGILGLGQMKRAQKIVNERRKIANEYNIAFKNITELKTPFEAKGFIHGYQSYPCLIKIDKLSENEIKKNKVKRNKLMIKLQKKGISTRPATHAVHMLAYYKKKYSFKPNDYLNSFYANDCSISLPLFNGMKKSEYNYVIDEVLKILR